MNDADRARFLELIKSIGEAIQKAADTLASTQKKPEAYIHLHAEERWAISAIYQGLDAGVVHRAAFIEQVRQAELEKLKQACEIVAAYNMALPMRFEGDLEAWKKGLIQLIMEIGV